MRYRNPYDTVRVIVKQVSDAFVKNIRVFKRPHHLVSMDAIRGQVLRARRLIGWGVLSVFYLAPVNGLKYKNKTINP